MLFPPRGVIILLAAGLLARPASLAHALHRDFTLVTVTGTAETAIFSIPLPGGTLSNAGGVRVVMWGDFINNSGANRTLTVTLRYGAAGVGGTVIATKTSDNIASAAVTGAFWAEMAMFNTGTTNSQRGMVFHQTDRGASGRVTICGTGANGVDSTVDQTLTVTITISGAGTTFNLEGAQASYL